MSWHAHGDWGTTRLRLFRIEGGVVTGRQDGPGIGQLDAAPDAVLRQALAGLGDAPPAAIRLCGMAGSRMGLSEAPYVSCPGGADDWRGAAARLKLDGIPLAIAPGFACEDADGRADVMRGEETQIFGALALEPELAEGECQLLLPGTHSKWALARGGRIAGFRTFLTGELFALLSAHSTLLAPGSEGGGADEEAGFAAGMERAATGGGLGGSLFETRSAQLRGGHSPGWARGFLSGLLIAGEIVEMRDRGGVRSPVIVIGAAALRARYDQALALFGIATRQMEGDTCALRGLELLDEHG